MQVLAEEPTQHSFLLCLGVPRLFCILTEKNISNFAQNVKVQNKRQQREKVFSMSDEK